MYTLNYYYFVLNLADIGNILKHGIIIHWWRVCKTHTGAVEKSLVITQFKSSHHMTQKFNC